MSLHSTGEDKHRVVFCAIEDTNLDESLIKEKLYEFLDSLGDRKKILLLPPDYTRYHSHAGKITQYIHEYYFPSSSSNKNEKEIDISMKILPTLGTHAPMTQPQIESMFGSVLGNLKDPSPFIVHDWRKDVVTIGKVPSSMVEKATRGMVENTEWPCQLNRLVWEEKHDLILSIGQVVPHEVMGMANFNKNLFVGAGGLEAINLSHFIGAVYGMEALMGQKSNPLRDILNYASEHFLHGHLPLWYILTVMGKNPTSGELEMKGFYIGNDIQCYLQACELSLKVNFTMFDKPLKKVVVYLDEDEYHSTWLGNKAIYRTRMAIADGGHLIILAPGVRKFGEDQQVDLLIRKYGYNGTQQILKNMKENEELQQNLSAVAHLIHGSTEGRFRVTYCPAHLTKEEIEGVGFQYDDYQKMSQRYRCDMLQDGWNNRDGEDDFFYISNPALGLWALRSKFNHGDGEEGFSTDNMTNKDCCTNNVDNKIDNNSIGESQVPSTDSAGVGGWLKKK